MYVRTYVRIYVCMYALGTHKLFMYAKKIMSQVKRPTQ